MPRTSRSPAGGYCYHVLNRGNARAEVFHKDQDFQAFLAMIAEASLRQPMRILAYCLMPNHFHLVLWPRHEAGRGSGTGPILLSQATFLLAHIANNGPVPLPASSRFPLSPPASRFLRPRPAFSAPAFSALARLKIARGRGSGTGPILLVPLSPLPEFAPAVRYGVPGTPPAFLYFARYFGGTVN